MPVPAISQAINAPISSCRADGRQRRHRRQIGGLDRRGHSQHHRDIAVQSLGAGATLDLIGDIRALKPRLRRRSPAPISASSAPRAGTARDRDRRELHRDAAPRTMPRPPFDHRAAPPQAGRSSSSTTTRTADIDPSINTRPHTALPRPPAPPSGRFDETDSEAFCTSTCASHDMTGFSARTAILQPDCVHKPGSVQRSTRSRRPWRRRAEPATRAGQV